jgi:hypothetical protein
MTRELSSAQNQMHIHYIKMGDTFFCSRMTYFVVLWVNYCPGIAVRRQTAPNLQCAYIIPNKQNGH